ncbi:MAG: transposase [Nannocystis sp.]|nr:transposase [Nannocystis sp.]MBA3545805.1 transposase [Nannocystis sp.]
MRRGVKQQHGLASVASLHAGVVTVVQRFRSDLGHYVHLHCLVTDGAYEEGGRELRFLHAPPPTPERMMAVLAQGCMVRAYPLYTAPASGLSSRRELRFMASAIFILDVDKVDPDRCSVTFKIRSTQSVRQMAVSRFFALRTLALNGRDDYAVCRGLKLLTSSMTRREREKLLGDRQTADQFITRTRITAIENYIDWENIDHDATLAKLLVAMELPASYHLEVHFSDPAHLAGIQVGDRLESYHADGWIEGIEALLQADPGNIYSFKGDDEHWRLHSLLTTYNAGGEDAIAWTNAHDTVTRMTSGLLPWQDGGRWGAVDNDGATRIGFTYDDFGYQDGHLHFKLDDRWISVAGLQ